MAQNMVRDITAETSLMADAERSQVTTPDGKQPPYPDMKYLKTPLMRQKDVNIYNETFLDKLNNCSKAIPVSSPTIDHMRPLPGFSQGEQLSMKNKVIFS